VVVTREPGKILDASHVVLPGVGAFRDCMRHLKEFGLIDPILRSIESGKPFLGICLGLQVLLDESDEFGLHKGLGLIEGRVELFPPDMMSDTGQGTARLPERLKVPHMGWNSITKRKESRLLDGVGDGEYFYFVHSYYAAPTDPSVTLTSTNYGIEFTSSIEVENMWAVQFHPEKSQSAGLKVLENFSRIR
jgi:glutamine amidotransferase